mgnify:CR=1 FL=1
MPITAVRTSTFLADTVILIRIEINDNITDPITRPSGEKLCITSYPKRSVTYPIVTVVDRGIIDYKKGGMASTVSYHTLGIEIRIWARNVKERDELAQAIYDRFRTRQVTFSATEKMHDYKVSGMENIDEPGEQGIKSKIFNIQFMEIMGE